MTSPANCVPAYCSDSHCSAWKIQNRINDSSSFISLREKVRRSYTQMINNKTDANAVRQCELDMLKINAYLKCNEDIENKLNQLIQYSYSNTVDSSGNVVTYTYGKETRRELDEKGYNLKSYGGGAKLLKQNTSERYNDQYLANITMFFGCSMISLLIYNIYQPEDIQTVTSIATSILKKEEKV